MGKKALAMLMILTIFFGLANTGFSQNKNPSREEVEKIIEEVATKRGIPSIILKCIAKIESTFRQFDKDGKPLIGADRYIGIMQIDGKGSTYNLQKLKNDPVYNVEAGVDHLLEKWKTANDKMVQIGNMDPNILEHWYFALWGYNGLSDKNDPNKNARTYQDRVYEIALKDYKQKITPISRRSVPSRGGYPRNDKRISTPKEYHEGDIKKYETGDIVKPDTMEKAKGKDPLILYDGPRGREIGVVKESQTMTILEGPVLRRGFYFYKVKINEDSREGWVYGNWIVLSIDN